MSELDARPALVPEGIMKLIENDLKLEDIWLYEFLKGWFAPERFVGSPAEHLWQVTVGIGMLFRFWNHPSQHQKAIVDSVLEGNPHPRMSIPYDWAKSLTAEQVDQLTGMADAKITMMRDQSELRVASDSWENKVWQRRLDQARHQRDEIESVRAVLAYTKRAVTLQVLLEDLDADWSRLVRSLLPAHVPMGDEQLRRVGGVIPDIWWAEYRTQENEGRS